MVSTTVSTYFNENLEYSSLYKYEDSVDFSEKYGVTIGGFKLRSSCNPDYFKCHDNGVQDKYHELHFGRPNFNSAYTKYQLF